MHIIKIFAISIVVLSPLFLMMLKDIYWESGDIPLVKFETNYIYQYLDEHGRPCSSYRSPEHQQPDDNSTNVYTLYKRTAIRKKDCDANGTEHRNNKGKCICKQNVEGEYCEKCKIGYFNFNHSNPLGCSECFCFRNSTMCDSSFKYMLDDVKPNRAFAPLNEQTNKGYMIYNYTREGADYFIIVHTNETHYTCKQKKLEVNLISSSMFSFENTPVYLTCDHNFEYPHLISDFSWFMNDTLIDFTETKSITLTLSERNFWCEINLVTNVSVSSNVIPIKKYFYITSDIGKDYVLLTCNSIVGEITVKKYEWLRENQLLQKHDLVMLNANSQDKVLYLDPKNPKSSSGYKCRVTLEGDTVTHSEVFHVKLEIQVDKPVADVITSIYDFKLSDVQYLFSVSTITKVLEFIIGIVSSLDATIQDYWSFLKNEFLTDSLVALIVYVIMLLVAFLVVGFIYFIFCR